MSIGREAGKKSSVMGWALMGLGVVVLLGTAVVWAVVRLPDALAVRALALTPTAAAPSSLPTVALAAEVEVAEIAAVAVDPGAALSPPEVAVPTFEPAPVQELPSFAAMSEAPTSLRAPVPGQPSRIVIPAIGVDARVRDVGLSSVYDASNGGDIFYQWQVPHEYAVGWHDNSAPLGQRGNTVLNGHHNIYGEVFGDLEDLKVGDGIIMYDESGSYVYEITRREILLERGQPQAAREANARWIAPSLDERLTLVSCWPYSDNSHRLIIVARRVEIDS